MPTVLYRLTVLLLAGALPLPAAAHRHARGLALVPVPARGVPHRLGATALRSAHVLHTGQKRKAYRPAYTLSVRLQTSRLSST